MTISLDGRANKMINKRGDNEKEKKFQIIKSNNKQ